MNLIAYLKTNVDKGSEFYIRSIRSFLQNNNIEMYSTHNEGNLVVPERFVRTLKNKIYKYMTSMLLVILKAMKFLERFTKKNCKKQIKNSLELKK